MIDSRSVVPYRTFAAPTTIPWSTSVRGSSGVPSRADAEGVGSWIGAHTLGGVELGTSAVWSGVGSPHATSARSRKAAPRALTRGRRRTSPDNPLPLRVDRVRLGQRLVHVKA